MFLSFEHAQKPDFFILKFWNEDVSKMLMFVMATAIYM